MQTTAKENGSSKKPQKTTNKSHRKIFKFRFLSVTSLHNVRRDQILFYILSLHKRTRSLLRKCRRYREKIAKLEQTVSASRKETTAAEQTVTDEKSDVQPNDTESNTNNFIADIKNAAHQAQNEMGFIYEPTSGLYFDSRTGYYYNAENGLYYDGNNGCYYSYNQSENKFEFHSQIYSADEAAEVKEDKVTCDDHLMQQFECLQLTDTDEPKSISSLRKRQKLTDSDNETLMVSRSRNQKRCHHSKSEQREDGELSDDNDSDDEENYDIPSRVNASSQIPQRKLIVYDIDDDSCSSSTSGQNSTSFADIAKKYPPSLRIIVQETNIRKLKIGELFLITYKGGTLGREGKHDVIVPDINCSKYHLKFVYNEKQSSYTCTDLGSRNGTFMNGQRMSNAKQESDPKKLLHGTILQIGQTKLLCHVHDGHSTCGQCEPGLLGDNLPFAHADATDNVTSGSSKSKPANVNEDHKRQLKNLKKRYGLQEENYVAPKTNVKGDRAEQRRKAVGSSCEYEKTKTASLNSSIPSENKGFKMLSKLGWSEGQSLGKNNDGLLEPIPLKTNENKKGLGCEGNSESTANFNDPKQKHKLRIWEKTHQRYHAADAAVDIFKNCSDDSD